MSVTLHGYHLSVYTRIALIALAEKGVAYQYQEIDPFSLGPDSSYQAFHPFEKVPTLVHDGLVIYETSAITRYIDESFAGIALQPRDPINRAQMNQIIAIVDSYGYWPMVRQVFSHRYLRPMEGESADERVIADALQQSAVVLTAIDNLCSDQDFLCGSALSLADIHLLPMIDYFQRTPEGAKMLADFAKLDTWWKMIMGRKSAIATHQNITA